MPPSRERPKKRFPPVQLPPSSKQDSGTGSARGETKRPLKRGGHKPKTRRRKRHECAAAKKGGRENDRSARPPQEKRAREALGGSRPPEICAGPLGIAPAGGGPSLLPDRAPPCSARWGRCAAPQMSNFRQNAPRTPDPELPPSAQAAPSRETRNPRTNAPAASHGKPKGRAANGYGRSGKQRARQAEAACCAAGRRRACPLHYIPDRPYPTPGPKRGGSAALCNVFPFFSPPRNSKGRKKGTVFRAIQGDQMSPGQSSREHVRTIHAALHRASHPSRHPRLCTPGASLQARRLQELLLLATARHQACERSD